MGLFSSLGTLESAGLIQVSKVEPDLEYLFRHSMVQDAAYASLLESDRKRLHMAVGDAIEKLYPERKKELAAILGYHFMEAGEDERALGYFIIAGDEALASYANQEAEIQYRCALGLMCCSGPEIARLYAGLGEALYRQNRFVESCEAFRSGIDICLSLENYDGVARMYSRIGRVEWYAGERPKGLKVCEEGLEVVKDAPDSLGKAMLIHEAARAYYFNGNSDKALPLCRQALKLAEQFGDLYLQSDALATLGILADVEPAESLEALGKSIEIAEANRYYMVAGRAHVNLGTMARTWNMDNETALVHYKRSAEIGRMRGVVSEELISLESYVSCLFTPGRLEEIEFELPKMEALVRQLPDPQPMIVSIEFIKGVLTFYKGDWDTALSVYKQCLRIFREQENHEAILNMLNELAWIILERQRWGAPAGLDEAESYLTEAVKMVNTEYQLGAIWAYPHMIILKARQGKLDEASQWMKKSKQRVQTFHSVWDERFELECEMELAIAQKHWDTAIGYIEKIVQMEHRLGFRAARARNLLCWGDLLIRRGNPGDLETAQSVLNQSIDECKQMGLGRYEEIAQYRLKLIQQKLHTQSLDNVNMTRELKKARRVQESLLPEKPPRLAGWDMTVLLEPAHETSGDFYDYIMMPNGNLGMVIADVTDKGTSAALYMALSRSLWRTFAANNPSHPEQTLVETNKRILADTHGGLFITLLYVILDPANGELTYSSAGHLPALVLRAKDGSLEEQLRIGLPLGVQEDAGWDKATIQIEPGDALLLYTDGITEAQNLKEEFFGMQRLKEILTLQRGKTASQIRTAIRSAVRDWVGKAEQFDDMTMIVLVRQ